MRAFPTPSLFSRPIVITNADFRFVVAEQLRERGIEADIVLEPMRRDSGPAVAVSAVLAAERDRDALVLVLAADHVVRKPDEFRASLPARCRSRGREGGSSPSASSPPIRRRITATSARARSSMAQRVHAVEAFVEKPDAATAATYVADRYLWNSGNFLFHAATMLARSSASSRPWPRPPRRRSSGLTRDLDFLRLAAEPFARAPKKSIDYAVMERTKLAAVVPADLGWSDVGSWSAVWDVLDHDAAGNATEGPVVMLDSRNSLVRSEKSVLTTVVGLDDVIVVSTADAVLVSARAKAEQVKTLVEQLKAQQSSRGGRASPHLSPLGLLPGRRHCPALQGEADRREAGQQALAAEALPSLRALGRGQGNGRGHAGRLTCAACTKTNRSTSRSAAFIGSPIPARFALELIEVQVGSYLGEDDIVRLDDVYGRG